MTTRTRTHTRRRRWSQKVTRNSHALDLEEGVFTKRSPRAIAESLKRSAEHSRMSDEPNHMNDEHRHMNGERSHTGDKHDHPRKSSPFRSAMSMLTFYMNRAGKTLSPRDNEKLTQAKDELRKLFHRGNSHGGNSHGGNSHGDSSNAAHKRQGERPQR